RGYRLGRVQDQLRAHDYGAAVLTEPMNIRYATGTRVFSVWTMHNAARWVFVPAEGKCVLFEFGNHGIMARSGALETIGEVRPARGWSYRSAVEHQAERVAAWAGELAELMGEKGGGSRRIAFDHLDPLGLKALEAKGLEVGDGERVMAQARLIKSREEIMCMCWAISGIETGMHRMTEALKPGMTEQELWSIIAQANAENGGEWMETRLLASGGRTNPWMQEAGQRRVRPGELVAFDADANGAFGYCADISRTFFCGPGKPTAEQKDLYKLAVDQVEHNMALLKPGVTFRQVVEKSFRMPQDTVLNRYALLHGVGLGDEYPGIPQVQDTDRMSEPDRVIEENMAFCVESYMGREGGAEGVKLEHQVVVTASGVQILDTYPWEEVLLG
ncbi:MAG: Xaa-Pro peptidase family protein, partial [Alphaproteobacteria bacterium]